MEGKTISHYKILDRLGEGGMGVVYKAEDTNLRRIVALKFLRQEVLQDGESKERFLREAQAAAALDHPNICTIYEIDQVDGHIFLSMAFVKGESLAIQIAEGLQAAHENKIVHRDVKSGNVMVTAGGKVKIMDFGLAHLEDRAKLTKTGARIGTPAYMSPEQVKGESTDRRSDVWSLGVVLYEMIAGRLPFRGETVETVAHSIIYATQEPLTALRSGLPIDLDRIIAKALAKLPSERYQHISGRRAHDQAGYQHSGSRMAGNLVSRRQPYGLHASVLWQRRHFRNTRARRRAPPSDGTSRR
jgi:serine/threonine protein kinase